jgi:hypothetical protein
MKRAQSLLFLLTSVLAIPTMGHAQAWSGIIDPSRAVDWSKAGILGGIPNRTTICASIAAYGTSGSPGSPSAINNAISSCPSGQVVSLGSGTFYLSAGVDFASHSNVTLRGQGANLTFLIFSAGGAGGYNSDVAMEGSVSATGYENDVCDWTSGYTRGTTVITLANCGTTTPAVGSLSKLKVGTLLVLDQLDETNDTGTIWNCETVPACTWNGPGGEARSNGPCNGTTCYRTQEQGVVVTNINGNQITISPGLYMPNWRSGQLPQAYFADTTVTGDGIENLSIDNTPAGGTSGSNINIANCTQCWVKGVRSIDANRAHVHVILGAHLVVRDSYFYKNVSSFSVSYGLDLNGASDSLIENNIFQQDTDSEPSCAGACAGNVIGYNFDIDNVWGSVGWMQAGFYQHSGGDALNLWEGNIGPGYTADQVHGTHHFETLFRNYLIGNQSAGCGSAGPIICTAETIPIQIEAGSRYFNIIGNVLGQSGYHNNYTCSAQSSVNCLAGVTSIFTIGYSGNGGTADVSNAYAFCTSPSCTATSNYDPQTTSSLMRWGNYDVVTAAVRWCGNSSDPGWSTTCGSTSEVPTALASYAQAVPSSTTLPVSFYLSSKPSWFGPIAWPPIGPDVSSGNISGAGGFGNANPAMNCYLNVMHGPSDGSGSVLGFNANSCYGTLSSGPLPPTNLSATVQ